MSMELDNDFTVPVPPDQAWDVLLDVQRIAPCMPGATVDEVDGDVVTGRIKVKVGPVSLTYRGTAKFTERDPDAHMVVVEASGKETRGSGTASATVRASLAPAGTGTQVTMHTTMNVTGRPAQFGRGVIVEVGGKLVEQFAQNLAHLIAGDTAVPADAGVSDAGVSAASVSDASVDGADVRTGAGAAEPGTGAPQAAGGETAVHVSTTTAPPPAPSNEESLNLVKLVGPAILKRLIPVIAATAIALLSLRIWRVRRRRAGEL
ncbi:MAG TPA: SRPBCC family protein [Streptosporangiaceae bacterium]|nr:SRPBCC family protein [Streptosporangiaceae bacterium]